MVFVVSCHVIELSGNIKKNGEEKPEGTVWGGVSGQMKKERGGGGPTDTQQAGRQQKQREQRQGVTEGQTTAVHTLAEWGAAAQKDRCRRTAPSGQLLHLRHRRPWSPGDSMGWLPLPLPPTGCATRWCACGQCRASTACGAVGLPARQQVSLCQYTCSGPVPPHACTRVAP